MREGSDPWRKAIPEARDRMQSRALVWSVGMVLAVSCLPLLAFIFAPQNSGPFVRMSAGIALTFGLAVWALRAATAPAAFWGAAICLLVTADTGHVNRSPIRSGLAPLMTLFVLTFLATRAGRRTKQAQGLAEDRGGRRASQVIANLGASGLVVIATTLGWFDRFSNVGGLLGVSEYVGPALLLATLCEATADTVSSEIGQAFGGRPTLLTTLRRVEPGTDGAVSLPGTAAGVLGAAAVAGVGMWAMALDWRRAGIALIAGIAGLLFDSLVGATFERRGWIGNDLVNFSSTVFAAAVALLLCLI